MVNYGIIYKNYKQNQLYHFNCYTHTLSENEYIRKLQKKIHLLFLFRSIEEVSNPDSLWLLHVFRFIYLFLFAVCPWKPYLLPANTCNNIIYILSDILFDVQLLFIPHMKDLNSIHSLQSELRYMQEVKCHWRRYFILTLIRFNVCVSIN